jgi:hypothetical protein
MTRNTERPFDIRIGDEYVFHTNTGGISRTIAAVEKDWIGYHSYGESCTRWCRRTTFRRWWRGASLEFATDWTDRASNA